jgi:hypothetical protein
MDKKDGRIQDEADRSYHQKHINTKNQEMGSISSTDLSIRKVF